MTTAQVQGKSWSITRLSAVISRLHLSHSCAKKFNLILSDPDKLVLTH